MGWGALLVAISQENILLVEYLIEKGAQVDDENEFGVNALQLAAYYNYKKIIKILVENRAPITENKNLSGYTASQKRAG